MTDTIVALSTPIGRSGIGIVRMSGSDALQVAGRIAGNEEFVPRSAQLHTLKDPDTNEIIDQAIVTWFKSPHSFTGEDVVEISCHGSPVLLRQVIDICLALGARMAEPGEFSLRALANGQLNLAQAEAIRDLIDAQTVSSARQAIRQLRGEFSDQLQPLKDKLLDVIVVLESALEFVEDDLPETQNEGVKKTLSEISNKIGRIAATFEAGKLLREGIRVALVGRPNVGKSSLFNALLGSDRAIVTDIAGTTRDQLFEKLTINNIPMSLVDTAGLRETSDTVESIGVERSRRTMADADLVIAIFDAYDSFTDEDAEILQSLDGIEHLAAVNKTDMVDGGRKSDFIRQVRGYVTNENIEVLGISAKTGAGLDDLASAIVSPFSAEQTEASGFLVSDARHFDLLNRAWAEVESSIQLLETKASEEIVLIGLHNALRYLGQITGETTTEDMLTRIFATFCIGK